MACFSLDEFETAKAAFEKGIQVAEEKGTSTKTFQTWVRKCAAEIEDDDDDDDDDLEEKTSVVAAPVVRAPTFR